MLSENYSKTHSIILVLLYIVAENISETNIDIHYPFFLQKTNVTLKLIKGPQCYSSLVYICCDLGLTTEQAETKG